MSETIYVKGIRVFPRHEKAPEFVKGSGVIAINDLVKFCKENPNYMSDYKGQPQLKFQILEGRKGLYFTVDAWQGDKKEPPVIEDDDTLPF